MVKDSYCFEPIGIVVKGLPKNKSSGISSRYQFVAEIKIFEEYLDGLRGLEEYSHIIVIWVLDRRRRVTLLSHPHGDPSAPLVGVFATRSPNRPTPIGLTVVELVRIDGSSIFVRGLDAWTGTPILDIKPYDYYDHVNSLHVPDWFIKYWVRKNIELGYSKIVPWLGPKEPK